MPNEPHHTDDPLSPLLAAAFAAHEGRVEARGESVVAQLRLSSGIQPTPLAFGSPCSKKPAEPDDPDAPHLATSTGSRYQILDELGRGGLGLVMRGHDVDLRREVALKVLRTQLADRKDLIERFLLEAQLGGQLEHPGIAPVYDLGITEDGRPFFIMKLVQGSTLAELLEERRGERGDAIHLLGIFSQICKAVGYAHARGVVHRDLKPANVMVGEFGEVQVVDWGLAKVAGLPDEPVESEQTPVPDLSAELQSRAGTIVGTPGYMSPEQARGETADAASDVYALGVMLLELLAERPLSRELPERIDFPYVRQLLDGQELAVQRLVAACLAWDPVQRPQDALEVARRIDAHMTRSDERAREAEVRAASEEARAEEAGQRLRAEARARRSTQLLAGGILVAAVGGLGGWSAWLQRAATRERTAAAAVGDLLDDVSNHRAAALSAPTFEGEAWARAEGAAEQAVSVAHLQGGGLALVERAESSLERIQDEGRAAREADQARQELSRDRQRLRELGEISMGNPLMSPATLHAKHREVLAELGIDLEDEVAAVADEVRAHPARVGLLEALDSLWMVTRDVHRRMGETPDERLAYGWSDEDAERAAAWAVPCGLAQAADDDSVLRRLRQAVLAEDTKALKNLLGDLRVDGLSERQIRIAASIAQSIELDTLAYDIRAKALLQTPGSFGLHFDQASLCSEDKEKWEEALGHYRSAVALRPDSAPTWHELGALYTYLDRLADSAACFERALDPTSDSFVPWDNLGRSYTRLGDWTSLERILERWQGQDVGPRARLVVRAESDVLRLRPQKAWESLDRALTIPTEDRWVRLSTARYLGYAGRGGEAIEVLERLVADIPDFAEAHCNLAHQYNRQARISEALAPMRRGHELGSARPDWRYPSSTWIATTEKYIAMAELIESGEEVTTEDPLDLLSLGWAACARKEFTTAVTYFSDVFDLSIARGMPSLGPQETRLALNAAFELTRPWPGEPSQASDELLIESSRWLLGYVQAVRGMLEAVDAQAPKKGRIYETNDLRLDACMVLSSQGLLRTREDGFADWVGAEAREAWDEALQAVERLEASALR